MSGTLTAPARSPQKPATASSATNTRQAPSPPPAPPQVPPAASAFPSIESLPPPPKPRALPSAPQFKPESPLTTLNTWGVALALFGSLLTRAPLTTALNAAATAIKSRRNNDLVDYRQNLAAFHDNLQKAIAQNTQDQSAYRSALSRARAGSEDIFHRLQLAATERHDHTMAMLAQERNGIEIDRLNEMRAEAGQRLAIAAATARNNADMQSRSQAVKVLVSLIAARETPPKGLIKAAGFNPDDKTWAGVETNGPSVGQQAKALATQAVLSGSVPVRFPLGKGDPLREAYNRALADLYAKSGPQANVAKANNDAAIKAEENLAAQAAKIGPFGGTFEANLKTLQGYIKAGGTGPSGNVLINQKVQWIRENAGSPVVAATNAIMLAVQDEYIRYLTASNSGGQTTDSAQKIARGIINGDMTVKQLLGVGIAMQADSVNRAGAYVKAYHAAQQFQAANAHAFAAGKPLPNMPDFSGILAAAPAWAPKRAPIAPSNAPPISMLRQGVLTHFANGQTWTIGPNGQAVRVR